MRLWVVSVSRADPAQYLLWHASVRIAIDPEGE